MYDIDNTEVFLADLKGRLKNAYKDCVRISARAASCLNNLAGVHDEMVISNDDEAEFSVPIDKFKSLIEQAERKSLPILRRRGFRIVG